MNSEACTLSIIFFYLLSKGMDKQVEEKRVITSAIESMSVAEVRRNLALIRRIWEKSINDVSVKPFSLTDELDTNGMTVSDFAMLFAIGHHKKRNEKKQKNLNKRH